LSVTGLAGKPNRSRACPAKLIVSRRAVRVEPWCDPPTAM
jgi:hypothetical protein